MARVLFYAEEEPFVQPRRHRWTPGLLLAPNAPTIGTAVAGNASALVAFTESTNDGGSAITGHTATSTPGSFTGTGSSPVNVTGLTNGTAYTFTVHSTNAIGNSPESASSNSVTPSSGGFKPAWAFKSTNAIGGVF